MVEIINGPVNMGEISVVARKRVVRTQQHGAAIFCIPVAVEIRGGTFLPVEGNKHPWDTVGEFRFSLFRDTGHGLLVEEVVRYNLTGDGRMRRLRVSQTTGNLDEGEVNDVEPMRLHQIATSGGEQPLRIRHASGVYVTERGVEARIGWHEDSTVRGVDSRVNKAINFQTGQEEAILRFIAVPEPGQGRGVEGFGGKFPSADRPRTVINSMDSPIPFLQPIGVVF